MTLDNRNTINSGAENAEAVFPVAEYYEMSGNNAPSSVSFDVYSEHPQDAIDNGTSTNNEARVISNELAELAGTISNLYEYRVLDVTGGIKRTKPDANTNIVDLFPQELAQNEGDGVVHEAA